MKSNVHQTEEQSTQYTQYFRIQCSTNWILTAVPTNINETRLFGWNDLVRKGDIEVVNHWPNEKYLKQVVSAFEVNVLQILMSLICMYTKKN